MKPMVLKLKKKALQRCNLT